MIKVIDKDGRPLPDTTRNGKVRRLLKDKQARVVNGDPFTIQLLYDTVDIYELEEKDNMKSVNDIIISNKVNRVPKGLADFDAPVVTYKDFQTKYNRTTINGIIYIDIDGITEEEYKEFIDSIRSLIYKTDKSIEDYVRFFRYKTESYINEKVTLVDGINESKDDRKKDLVVQLSEDLYTNGGHILISGMIGSGKTTLIKNIVRQLRKRNMEFHYASVVPNNETISDEDIQLYNKSTNVKQLAKLLKSIQTEMTDRFNKIETETALSIYNLKDPVKNIVVIIDGLNEYMMSDDYKSVDSIRHDLLSICRLGLSAGILVIIACHRPNGNTISTELSNFMLNRINTGKIADSGTSQLLFSDDVRLGVPFGMGIYQDAYDTENNYSVFTVNDVNKF